MTAAAAKRQSRIFIPISTYRCVLTLWQNQSGPENIGGPCSASQPVMCGLSWQKAAEAFTPPLIMLAPSQLQREDNLYSYRMMYLCACASVFLWGFMSMCVVCVWLYGHVWECGWLCIHMFPFISLCKVQFKFYTLGVSTFLEHEDISAGWHYFRGLFKEFRLALKPSIIFIYILRSNFWDCYF